MGGISMKKHPFLNVFQPPTGDVFGGVVESVTEDLDLGSVTTNKVIATLLANLGLQVQAYPKYGSEKKGLPTTYYLTIAEEPIRLHSELNQVEFIPVNDLNASR